MKKLAWILMSSGLAFMAPPTAAAFLPFSSSWRGTRLPLRMVQSKDVDPQQELEQQGEKKETKKDFPTEESLLQSHAELTKDLAATTTDALSKAIHSPFASSSDKKAAFIKRHKQTRTVYQKKTEAEDASSLKKEETQATTSGGGDQSWDKAFSALEENLSILEKQVAQETAAAAEAAAQAKQVVESEEEEEVPVSNAFNLVEKPAHKRAVNGEPSEELGASAAANYFLEEKPQETQEEDFLDQEKPEAVVKELSTAVAGKTYNPFVQPATKKQDPVLDLPEGLSSRVKRMAFQTIDNLMHSHTKKQDPVAEETPTNPFVQPAMKKEEPAPELPPGLSSALSSPGDRELSKEVEEDDNQRQDPAAQEVSLVVPEVVQDGSENEEEATTNPFVQPAQKKEEPAPQLPTEGISSAVSSSTVEIDPPIINDPVDVEANAIVQEDDKKTAPVSNPFVQPAAERTDDPDPELPEGLSSSVSNPVETASHQGSESVQADWPILEDPMSLPATEHDNINPFAQPAATMEDPSPELPEGITSSIDSPVDMGQQALDDSVEAEAIGLHQDNQISAEEQTINPFAETATNWVDPVLVAKEAAAEAEGMLAAQEEDRITVPVNGEDGANPFAHTIAENCESADKGIEATGSSRVATAHQAIDDLTDSFLDHGLDVDDFLAALESEVDKLDQLLSTDREVVAPEEDISEEDNYIASPVHGNTFNPFLQPAANQNVVKKEDPAANQNVVKKEDPAESMPLEVTKENLFEPDVAQKEMDLVTTPVVGVNTNPFAQPTTTKNPHDTTEAKDAVEAPEEMDHSSLGGESINPFIQPAAKRQDAAGQEPMEAVKEGLLGALTAKLMPQWERKLELPSGAIFHETLNLTKDDFLEALSTKAMPAWAESGKFGLPKVTVPTAFDQAVNMVRKARSMIPGVAAEEESEAGEKTRPNAWIRPSKTDAEESTRSAEHEDDVPWIQTSEEYYDFLRAHSDKLVILTFRGAYLPQAFKELKLQSQSLQHHPEFDNVAWADVLVSTNPYVEDPFTDFVAFQLGVGKIPSMRFYVNAKEVDKLNYDPSGCSWPTLEEKIIMSLSEGKEG